MTATVKPAGLLEKHKLLGAVLTTSWATRIDHKITWHAIERYYAKFKCARLSLRFLEQATGYGRNKIIPSLRKLEREGVIVVIKKGAGTRPTEYDLNFNFGKNLPSGSETGTATLRCPNGTPIGSEMGPATPPSGAESGTETYLRNPSLDGLTVSNADTPAVPSAPPVVGLPPASADSAVDSKKSKTPFDELFAAYPRKHKISAARDAYNKLAPSQELHAEILASAATLAAHHKTENTEIGYIKHLHNWLAEEAYREELPVSFKNKKASIKAVGEKDSDDIEKSPSDKIGLSLKTPTGKHIVEIVGSEVECASSFDGDSTVRFDFRIRETGNAFSHRFYLWCENEETREAGQLLFEDIRKATGVIDPNDTPDFHGKTLRAIVSKGGHIKYEKFTG